MENNFRIIFGEFFVANGFEVKVALKKGFENGHRSTFIEVNAEQLKTGMKSNYKIPFYTFVSEQQFADELNRVKNYYSAPVIKEKVSPMEMGLVSYGLK